MILQDGQKISAVIDKKETQQQKGAAYLEVGQNPAESFLYATNGRILVKMPTDGLGDSSGFISRESLEAAEKQKPLKAIVATPGHAQVVNGPLFTRPAMNKQINYDIVLEKAGGEIVIAFDVALLKRIADAFGDSKVIMSIKDATTAFKIEPYYRKGPVAAMMGIKI